MLIYVHMIIPFVVVLMSLLSVCGHCRYVPHPAACSLCAYTTEGVCRYTPAPVQQGMFPTFLLFINL